MKIRVTVELLNHGEEQVAVGEQMIEHVSFGEENARKRTEQVCLAALQAYQSAIRGPGE